LSISRPSTIKKMGFLVWKYKYHLAALLWTGKASPL
jgi:hypothetical protein